MPGPGRPLSPRVTLPVKYALLDNLEHVRALCETPGAALSTFVDLNLNDDPAFDGVEITTDIAVRELWSRQWLICELTKSPTVIVQTYKALDLDETKFRVKDDDYVIHARPTDVRGTTRRFWE